VLDLLRRVRGLFNEFSEARILGIPMDWFFHLVGAAAVFLIASRWLARRRALLVTVGALLAKEVFDVFAKTRLEYIRPPGLDLLVDLSAGAAGILIGWLVRRRLERRERA
jgi:hypothetical protein